jgi:hypothetical protein
MKKLSLIAITVAILSISVFADIRLPETPTPTPKPKPATGKQVEMVIRVTPDVSEPTLVIKKSSVKSLRAALDEAEGIDNLATQEVNETVKPASAIGSTQTIVGGLFLSLAFAFGGVWFVKNKPNKTTVVIFLLAIVGTSTVLVWGNAIPPRLYSISKNIFADEVKGYGFAKGKVRLSVVAESESDIKLLVPSTDSTKTPNEE